jgi:hypothetical protein
MAIDETEREVEVLDIFRQLLGAPQLGPEQNFFESGGSSLLAARLAARLRASGVLDVPTSAVFAAPTARALTRYASSSAQSRYAGSSAQSRYAGSSAQSRYAGSSAQSRYASSSTQSRYAGSSMSPRDAGSSVSTHTAALPSPSSAAERGARQRAAFARLRPNPSPDEEAR